MRSGLLHRRLATRLTLLAWMSLAGCSHGSKNLTGHWRGVKADGVRSDVLETTNSFATHMRFDVKEDVITVTTQKETRTDRYTVISEDKTRTVISTDLDGTNDPQTFTFTDATNMKWSVSSGATISFVKE